MIWWSILMALTHSACLNKTLDHLQLDGIIYGRVTIDSGSMPGTALHFFSDSTYDDIDTLIKKFDPEVSILKNVTYRKITVNIPFSEVDSGVRIFDQITISVANSKVEQRMAYSQNAPAEKVESLLLKRDDTGNTFFTIIRSDHYYFKLDVSLTDTLSKAIEIEILGEIQLVGSLD